VTVIPFDATRFHSTAAHYDKRVPYPAALIQAIAERVGLQPGDAVLDLGCGPAPIAIALARLAMRVTAMDPNAEMLDAARAAAAPAGVEIELREGSSYDLSVATGRFRLVTMGRSFHWMDRVATLAARDTIIEPSGAIALLYDRRISATPDWPAIVSELAGQFASKHAEARQLRRTPAWAPHEAILLQSAFSQLQATGRIFAQTLTLDDIVGRTHSMSVTSPEALGDNAAAFEATLRQRLHDLAPDGTFAEIVAADAILAFRP